MVARILLALALVLIAFPAEAAASGVQVPEASSLTLFALGIVGVILGRRMASGHGSDPDHRD